MATLTPEQLATLRDWFSGQGSRSDPRFANPANWNALAGAGGEVGGEVRPSGAFNFADGSSFVPGGGRMTEPGYTLVHPGAAGAAPTGSLFDSTTGAYNRETKFDPPDKIARFLEAGVPLALLGGMGFLAAPNILAALGGGAGAAGGSLASGAGLGTTGAGLTGGMGTTAGLGYGIGTLPELAGAGYGAGGLGLDAAMAGMGAAGAAGGALGGSAGSGSLYGGAGGDTLGSATFNPAMDSQLANEAIGGDALSGYTAAGVPSVTVNGAPSGGFLSSVGSLLGHSGTNTVGDGFDWSKLIGPGLSAVGGIQGAGAAKDAAAILAQSAADARAQFKPWVDAGGWAIGQAGNMLGRNGADAAKAAFTTSPDYQWRLGEGQKALERARSSSGSLGSGRYLKDLTDYNQNQASQEFGNSYNRLANLAGMGQTATGSTADLTTQAGNAAAAGRVGQANALTGAIGQGLSMYQTQQQADQNNALMNLLLRR